MTTRRTFIRIVPLSAAALLVDREAFAQGAVDEKDPQATALGYVADTTKADKAKFPKHTNDQTCSNCQLYTGKADSTSGPCTLFGGKSVASKGWCSAWVKKA
jgi:hypothetical protein